MKNSAPSTQNKISPCKIFAMLEGICIAVSKLDPPCKSMENAKEVITIPIGDNWAIQAIIIPVKPEPSERPLLNVLFKAED